MSFLLALWIVLGIIGALLSFMFASEREPSPSPREYMLVALAALLWPFTLPFYVGWVAYRNSFTPWERTDTPERNSDEW